MKDDELIAKQARRIAELEQEVECWQETAKIVRGVLFCIGGPLNDNKHGYTKEQLGPFFRIANAIGDAE